MILDLFTRELFPIFCIWKNASALLMAPAPVNSINILKQYQQRHCIVNCIKEPTAERKIKSTFTLRQAGLLIFRGKKSEFSRDFKGQIRGKIGRFRGIFAGKKKNSRNNRPISRDFRGRKVKIRRKIGRFRGILAEKSQFSKDFQGQILRKISRFHGKFRGETSLRNNQ